MRLQAKVTNFVVVVQQNSNPTFKPGAGALRACATLVAGPRDGPTVCCCRDKYVIPGGPQMMKGSWPEEPCTMQRTASACSGLLAMLLLTQWVTCRQPGVKTPSFHLLKQSTPNKLKLGLSHRMVPYSNNKYGPQGRNNIELDAGFGCTGTHLHWAPQHAARACRRHQQLLAQASKRPATRHVHRLVHEHKAARRQSMMCEWWQPAGVSCEGTAPTAHELISAGMQLRH